MRRPLTQFITVAAYELVDAIRSWRAIVLLVLYLLGSVVSCVFFIKVLHKVEVDLVESMGLTASSEPGRTTRVLWESKDFRKIVTRLVGNRELAEQLLSVPPIVLFYSWLSLTFAPLLVMMLASSRIAEEVYTSSIRYVLFRTERSTWILGKLTGQAIMLAVALLLSGAGACLTAWIRMPGFSPLEGLVPLLVFSSKAWIYCFSYLGLAFCVSQWCRSPVMATAIGLLLMIVVSIVAGVSTYKLGQGGSSLWNLLYHITPQGHRLDLWYPNWSRFAPAGCMLIVLGFCYFFLGYGVFSRRDQ